ncbi:helix-turn-helix domain-containing protein [Flavobacterium poyangense]|uniref:helix-turn-helix domain-containing protein n=1 Tax=Flavobacterium poyangense TaxID=2204302 RepID=UPI0014216914|nr:helix-turn-helix transcriptional regulator [Flavobacterium sp. JXAS1]
MNLFIGHKLKTLRRNRGWTQEWVSNQLFISSSAYAYMESGESQLWVWHIAKICEIFEITPEVLFEKEVEIKGTWAVNDELTQNALLNVYRKIIKRYEVQISELQQTIKDLQREKEQ